MPTMSDDAFVRFVQQRLASAGHYTGQIDGKAGPATKAAVTKAINPLVRISAPPSDVQRSGDPQVLGSFSASLAKLTGVHPTLQSVVIRAQLSSPVSFLVTEGLRTRERQATLFKAGASKTMNSRHLTGHAVDLWPTDASGKPIPSDATFAKHSERARKASAELWRQLRIISIAMKQAAKDMNVGLVWGGDWGWDAPHFEIPTSTPWQIPEKTDVREV